MDAQTQQVIRALSDFKLKNSDRYHITALGVFGSVARGESREDSDVDVAVEFAYSTLFSISRMQVDLENILGRKVDLVSLKSSMLPGFKEEILKDIIYV